MDSVVAADTEMVNAAPVPNGHLRDVLPAGISHGIHSFPGLWYATFACLLSNRPLPNPVIGSVH